MRIGIVAPSCRIDRDVVQRVSALAAGRAELVWHPQCFLSDGHFAGPDEARAEALMEVAHDPHIDAVWFARGGYGAARLIDKVRFGDTALTKKYLGYSDAGTLLAMLYDGRATKVAHGPMPADVRRAAGEAAIVRALDWLIDGAASSLEPSLGEGPAAAFNICILAHLVGSTRMPDLEGHVLMLEEVSEHLYRVDRDCAQIFRAMPWLAGVRLGRVSDVPPNDPDFGMTAEEIVRFWCEETGVDYLGSADIGHDAQNKVVPFGSLAAGGRPWDLIDDSICRPPL